MEKREIEKKTKYKMAGPDIRLCWLYKLVSREQNLTGWKKSENVLIQQGIEND